MFAEPRKTSQDNTPVAVDAAAADSPEIADLPTKLALLKEIEAPQAQIGEPGTTVATSSSSNPSRTLPAMRTEAPEGSYTMNMAEFRSYKKDVDAYKILSNCTEPQIVLQLRLRMDAELKRIIDTNYPNWNTLTVDEAVEAVGKIVQETSNPVVYRKHFNEITQQKDEKVQDFLTKLRACAVDCAFVCPYDPTHDLTDYHILNRVMTAIYDDSLQQEVLQKHETLNTLDKLIRYCDNFESTKKDRDRLKQQSDADINCISSDVSDLSELAEEEILAAVSAYRRQKKGNNSQESKKQSNGTCGRFGYDHGKKKKCPANGQTCLKCGKSNHFSRVCHSTTSNNTDADKVTSAILKLLSAVLFDKSLCSTENRDGLPRLKILVGNKCVPSPQYIDAIPDTGAQVTVAGEVYLGALQIKEKNLRPPTDTLKHAAGGKVPIVGSCFLSITVNSTSTLEEVYFVPYITRMFLSIEACKGLKLIHRDFPYHINAVDRKNRKNWLHPLRRVLKGAHLVSHIQH